MPFPPHESNQPSMRRIYRGRILGGRGDGWMKKKETSEMELDKRYWGKKETE